jgi:hypothetical protein
MINGTNNQSFAVSVETQARKATIAVYCLLQEQRLFYLRD